PQGPLPPPAPCVRVSPRMRRTHQSRPRPRVASMGRNRTPRSWAPPFGLVALPVEIGDLLHADEPQALHALVGPALRHARPGKRVALDWDRLPHRSMFALGHGQIFRHLAEIHHSRLDRLSRRLRRRAWGPRARLEAR